MGLFRNSKPVQVSVGSRYRVGDSPLMVWEVANLFQGIDGTPYASVMADLAAGRAAEKEEEIRS